MQKEKLTGYPSIDKPWLKYYTQEATIKVNPNCGMYRFMRERNANGLQNIALNYFGRKVTYGEMFERIDAVARALHSIGVGCSFYVLVSFYAVFHKEQPLKS